MILMALVGSASPPQSSSKPSDRSVLTQQVASVLVQTNVSSMHSPTIIFGHKSATALHSNDPHTAIVSTVEPCGTSFGIFDKQAGSLLEELTEL